ncbi:MAG: GNAT family N-acetyltransferase [Methylobacterium sp.]|nr:GNAT family N-acetyltransferase [Methylobacterium sp.]MCA3602729.1 GNAT family N-acetyltransferase [Methylobacterium sp.]MCA3615651.1 GNAT family N-acetyltransferase [Methylobacterium sp.]MCA3624904.1 GNAT family N-acetyltransferase [Methylobacterium sp.]MCA4909615.1 GNAT family N-acetyltransferase [Methylobacterium sp.]
MRSWLWPWTWWMGGLATAMRPALMSDSWRLAEIHASGFAQGWGRLELERMLLDGHIADVQVSQALIGEFVTGFAISRVVAGEAELLTIALDPETRGRGLAKPLLAQHAQNVRRAGGEVLFLEVAEDNAPALALYRGLGFREFGRRKAYYPGEPGGRRRDALTMRADLSGLDPTPRYR